MDQHESLTRLEGAKAAERPWAVVADILSELEGAANAGGDPKATPWLYLAARATGYGTGQLRRMLRARAFLHSFAKLFTDQQIRTLRTVPVSAVEVLMRLHSLDPDLAIEKLTSYLHSRGPSYRELLKIYENASATTKKMDNLRSGMRLARDFSEICLNLIRENIFQLTGDRRAEIIRPARYAFEFTHPDFVLVQRHSGFAELTIADAVEVHTVTSHPKSTSTSRLHADVALASSFFRWFWVFMSDGANVGDADAAFTRLGLENVGIVSVDMTDPPICRVRRIPKGRPAPDRRNLIKI